MKDTIDAWFQSGKAAEIENIHLRPIENPFLRNTALVVSRGQANVFFLQNGAKWILKKFLPSRKPDRTYIEAIESILPKCHSGFESGTQRKVLKTSSLSKSDHYSQELAEWLDEAVLMPFVAGLDWATLADKLRDGKISLAREQRLQLSLNLSRQISMLENNGVAHRDLSSTNIMIDTHNWQVHLIDWDSLYHGSLKMPHNTTYGTNGYISPLIKASGAEDPGATWCPFSDRFSASILCIEFMAVKSNSSFTGDGGIFEQNELYQRGGQGLARILKSIESDYPDAVGLFKQALNAKRFEDCPAPGDWVTICRQGTGFTAPSLNELYDPVRDLAAFVKKRNLEPAHPVPSLNDLDPVAWESTSSHPTPTNHAPLLGDMPDPVW